MLTLPISQIGINKEWTIICAMAKSNGFPESIIHNLRKKLTLKKNYPEESIQNAEHHLNTGLKG